MINPPPVLSINLRQDNIGNMSMKQFAILENQEGLVQAVPMGKSWFAFFLTPIWAALNSMWVIAGTVLLFDIVMLFWKSFLSPEDIASQPEGTAVMYLGILIAYHIYFMIKAPSLEIKKLISEGFQQKEISLAVNKDTAISAYKMKK